MLTFAIIQLFFSSVGIISKTLYKYHYPNLVAQVCMFVFNIVPLDIVRLLSIVTLGVASVSSSFCWFLSFVRFWRYLFFPTKQNFVFVSECLLNLAIITPQLIFYLYQARQLATNKKRDTLRYKHYLYSNAVSILFFHDFFYGAFFYNTDVWYSFFGFTQFIVHALMMFLPNPDKENEVNMYLFVVMWIALLGQHILTIVLTYTDSVLSEETLIGDTRLGSVIRWLASVYVLSNIIYLLNFMVYLEFDPLWRIRPYIDSSVRKVDDFIRSRGDGSNRLAKPRFRVQ